MITDIAVSSINQCINDTQNRRNLSVPFVQIFLDLSKGLGAIGKIVICITSNVVTGVPQDLYKIFGIFYLFLVVVSTKGIFSGRVGAIAEQAVIAGYSQNGSCSFIGKVRMGCNEGF